MVSQAAAGATARPLLPMLAAALLERLGLRVCCPQPAACGSLWTHRDGVEVALRRRLGEEGKPAGAAAAGTSTTPGASASVGQLEVQVRWGYQDDELAQRVVAAICVALRPLLQLLPEPEGDAMEQAGDFACC